MTVPPLPVELLSLIIDHLASLLDNNDVLRRQNGLAVALVCRAWRKLGTDLAWNTTRLDSVDRMRRVVAHLEQHPTLAEHVQHLELEDDESFEAAEVNRTILNTTCLFNLISPTLRLVSLRCDEQDWVVGSLLVHELSRSRSAATLQHLSIREAPFEHDISAFLAAISRLPRLSNLSLSLLWTSDVQATSAFNLPASVLPIDYLHLQLYDNGAAQGLALQLCRGLINLVNLSTLREFSCIVSSADLSVLSALSRFPHLSRVSLLFHAPDALPVLRALVNVLAHLRQLNYMNIVLLPDDGSGDPALRLHTSASTFVLGDLLTAIPPSLHHLSLNGIDFPPASFPALKNAERMAQALVTLQAEGEEANRYLYRETEDEPCYSYDYRAA
ncbi:hypothetical protein JCM11251_005410 [Rhodosporidiobolus azoricus]